MNQQERRQRAEALLLSLTGEHARNLSKIESALLDAYTEGRREQELVAFVRKIAAMGTCDDPAEQGKCYQDSGPYCGAHPHFISDDEIAEARALIAKLDSPPGRDRTSETERE